MNNITKMDFDRSIKKSLKYVYIYIKRKFVNKKQTNIN